MPKTKFCDHLKRLARERGAVGGDLAEQIDCSASSLRVWMIKNSFPEGVLEEIATWMGPPWTAEEIVAKFEVKTTQMRRKYSLQTLQEDTLTRLLPLLKPLAASGYTGELTAEDLVFLFRVQAGLGQGLSPAAIKELLGLRHPPPA